MRREVPLAKQVVRYVVLVAALILHFQSPVGGAQPAEMDPQGFPRRPKLVVVLVIDQFRFDYLMRFRPQFVEGGFNLLLKGGANFVNCLYDYVTTETGPGHATLFTGAYGNLHGIVQNEWYDRALHRPVYCVEDREATVVGENEGAIPDGGVSPRNLWGSTIGDELRMASGFRSKVIAISLKDRAAVLAGGHTANAAYWYDSKSGRFVTSSYYMPALPSWAKEFNRGAAAKAYCGKPWQGLRETPGAEEQKPFEEAPTGGPCPNPAYFAWLMGTPFMNEVELNFALEAVRGERLGQGPSTDLLAISLSINDYIGHQFGPYSPQVADVVLRTDRYLADFFAALDRLVGMNNIWVVLSADHGVAPSPQYIAEHNLGLGRLRPATVREAIEKALTQSFGNDNWIEAMQGSYVTLNIRTLEKRGLDRSRVEAIAAAAATSVLGVRAAFTRTQFLSGTLPSNPLAHKAANSFNLQRSGDILLIGSEFAVPSSSMTGSTHGSLWSYDSQVPLILWGSAFKPGVYGEPSQPVDMAATLAAAMGITQPSGAQGQPLVVALR
jgi:predicted AlkP superfamily pyrophosphatase or phosphodiesterase